MEKKIVELLIHFRYLFALLGLVIILTLALGAKNLFFNSDYTVFFDDDNPQLLAHEAMQENYIRTDNLSILIQPEQGDIFTKKTLRAIKKYSDAAWQAPYSIRVDSVTNYQHSWAEQDDLLVEDMVSDVDLLNEAELERIQRVVLGEKQLRNFIISPDGKTTVINISLELPEVASKSASFEEQAKQRALREKAFSEIVAYGSELKAQIETDLPSYEVHLMGIPIINNSFTSSAIRDASTLLPAMYLAILVIIAVFLRSFSSLLGVSAVIFGSTIAALGAGGWLGFTLTTVTSSVPTIILTIAVCDSVHLLVSYLRELAISKNRIMAMRESLTINLHPIVLTSVTTAVGFLTLNFSDSPTFRQLGNFSAIGVMLAMVLTFCLLPTLSILLIRKRKPLKRSERSSARFIEFVLTNRKAVFVSVLGLSLLLVLQIPRNHIDDDPIKYFKAGVPYRDAAVFSQENLPAIKNVDFSMSCGEPGCVNTIPYLERLRKFSEWAEKQEGVEYVGSYIDVIKRLNQNMNHGDANFYTLPDSQPLAAQYQLLYEMSLPYGLDLNNQVNFDKSATRIRVFMRQVSTGNFLAFEHLAQDWFAQNYPEGATPGSSVHIMFAAIGEKNIRSMSVGAIAALIGVTLTILVSLWSFKYAAISLIPNGLPAAMALGVWGLTIAEVNMAVAVVFSITLGIIVDDTVHFISKYRRARELHGKSAEESIRYAFSTVAGALIITSSVLAIGFGLLAFSDFNLNAYMGGLTAITIVIAIVFDFFMLPALLMIIDGGRPPRKRKSAEPYLQ